LVAENVTLAELLSQAGYRTAGIVANYGYLHRGLGFDQGFDYYDDQPRVLIGYEPVVSSALQFFPAPYYELTKPYRIAEEVNQAAFCWLEINSRRPFFLFLNYMEPHDPYYPPSGSDRYREAFKKRFWDPLQTKFVNKDRFAAPESERLLGLYDGEIGYLDEKIGQLLEKLMELGAYENTLIILTSDHGEFFGEHGLWGHGLGPYEEVHRVPLVIKYPHSKLRGVEEAWVQTLDIFPTVLRAVGLSIPPLLDGTAIPGLDHPIIAEQYYSEFNSLNFGPRFGQAYRTLYEEPWKLTLYSDGVMKLYNLVEDTAEEYDLAIERNDLAREMRDRLERYVASLVPVDAPDARERLDADTLERLRSLGYLQ